MRVKILTIDTRLSAPPSRTGHNFEFQLVVTHYLTKREKVKIVRKAWQKHCANHPDADPEFITYSNYNDVVGQSDSIRLDRQMLRDGEVVR